MSVTTPSELDRALWALRGYDTMALGTVSAAGPHVAGVFFAPEASADGLRLVLASVQTSRKAREMRADPRVAFMCSPGNPSRWVQGTGRAEIVDDSAQHAELYATLTAHASGAKPFIERLATVPVIVTVETIKVVEELGRPPLLLRFDGGDTG